MDYVTLMVTAPMIRSVVKLTVTAMKVIVEALALNKILHQVNPMMV
jgi:hypothetical protein